MKPVKMPGGEFVLEAEGEEIVEVTLDHNKLLGKWLVPHETIPDDEQERILAGDLDLLSDKVHLLRGENVEPGTYRFAGGVSLVYGDSWELGSSVSNHEGDFRVLTNVPLLPFVKFEKTLIVA